MTCRESDRFGDRHVVRGRIARPLPAPPEPARRPPRSGRWREAVGRARSEVLFHSMPIRHSRGAWLPILAGLALGVLALAWIDAVLTPRGVPWRTSRPTPGLSAPAPAAVIAARRPAPAAPAERDPRDWGQAEADLNDPDLNPWLPDPPPPPEPGPVARAVADGLEGVGEGRRP